MRANSIIIIIIIHFIFLHKAYSLIARSNRPENGGGSFVHSLGTFLPDCMESHPKTVPFTVSAKGTINSADASCFCHVMHHAMEVFKAPNGTTKGRDGLSPLTSR
jgi:hypothetical protein